MKVVIVGGVAGGASAVARLRRLNETAEIILLERGPYVSYANCGLPYYIGGEIRQKSALTVQTPESLHSRLNLDVRTLQEAVEIDRANKTVTIQNHADGTSYKESYDKLILSPGAEPIRPSIPGVNDPRVFTLRNIPDTYAIEAFLREEQPKKALVVGGGFIGLEMAENLSKAGLAVTVTELANHIIGPLDPEMARDAEYYLKSQGVELLLNCGIEAIEPGEVGLRIQLSDRTVETDMVMLCIGVRPDTALAAAAGLTRNARGALVVDSFMRTNDPNIYAVGDAVEVTQPVSGTPRHIPLAGPANKQGRIAAGHICGIEHPYRGTLGASLLKLFDLTVGSVGLNEQTASENGIDYDKVYLLTASHASYYPNSRPISLKVLFEQQTGRILGGQLVGFDGVDKRLDVLSMAIRHRMTADDLAEFEHGYAPPFSSAKDPLNMVGFMIQNLLEDNIKQYHWNDVSRLISEGHTLVDVRTPAEYAAGHIEGAVNYPVDDLRKHLNELDRSKPLYIYCQSGQRSYLTARILAENGFNVQHLAGGYRLYLPAVTGKSLVFGGIGKQ